MTAITIPRAASSKLRATVLDADGAPYLWSIASGVWCTGKLDLLDADIDAVFQKVRSDMNLTTDGTAIIDLDPEDTDSLPNQVSYIWIDLKIKDNNGDLWEVIPATKVAVQPIVTFAVA